MAGALFLDRDGVINEAPPEGAYVTEQAAFHMLPGVPEALADLRRELPTLRIVVVTNQRAIDLGLASAADVDAIHDTMRGAFRAAGADVDAVLVCPHGVDVCDCRKPGIGLFLRACELFPEIDPAASVVVGDSLADVEAGDAFGALTVLVGHPVRRAHVRGSATSRGLRVDDEAASLSELVADGRLVAWLAPGPPADLPAGTLR